MSKKNDKNRPNRTGVMATNAVDMTLEPADIPCADLNEPFEKRDASVEVVASL